MPTQLDSDDEPLVATSVVARQVRSEASEAFDLTIADSDASESPRAGRSATGEDRQEGSQQLRSNLAVRASAEATDQEFPGCHELPVRRRKRLRITWQGGRGGARVLQGQRSARCGGIDSQYGPEDWRSTDRWSRSAGDPAPKVVIVECPTHRGRSRGQSVCASDQMAGVKGFTNTCTNAIPRRPEFRQRLRNTKRVICMVEEPRVPRNPTRTTFACKSTGFVLP